MLRVIFAESGLFGPAAWDEPELLDAVWGFAVAWAVIGESLRGKENPGSEDSNPGHPVSCQNLGCYGVLATWFCAPLLVMAAAAGSWFTFHPPPRACTSSTAAVISLMRSVTAVCWSLSSVVSAVMTSR